MMDLGFWALGVCVSSFAVTYLLSSHPTLKRQTTVHYRAVQAIHTRPTPRTGGIAVVLVCIVSSLFWLSNAELIAVVVACLPVVLGGLLEDLGQAVSPRTRLALTAVACVSLYLFSGAAIERIELDKVDALLSWPFAAIAFTIFVLSGVTHAFNLVDGLNGLLAVVTFFSGVALAGLAHAVGDVAASDFLLIVVSATCGFAVWNFPSGKVFMGDTGSYFLGFALGATGAYLIAQHSEVSPWSVLLSLFWPLHETLLTMGRRVLSGQRVFAPDKQHTHHLVLRLIKRIAGSKISVEAANPIATVVLIPFVAAPPMVSLLCQTNPTYGFLSVLGFLLFYTVAYILLSACSAPSEHD
jgi:UDP-GlcNAc:undecaprenyl-phosphate/decaprenyl-phosphate GlcNAc-1-phosphate transferase